MSEKDTIQAEQNNPAPNHKSGYGRNEPGTDSKVIPAILTIVLAVVVVATFFEDEYNSLLAMLGLSEEDTASEVLTADKPAEETIVSNLTVSELEPNPSSTDVTGNSARDSSQNVLTTPVNVATDTTDNAADTFEVNPPGPVVKSVIAQGSDQSAVTTSITTATDSSAESTGDDVDMASSGQAPAQPGSPTPSKKINSYYASPDYGTPYQPYAYQRSEEQRELIAQQRKIWDEIENQRRRDWEEMMEYRRQAWLEAEAARREHLENMHNIRTTVLKRIEQDRVDMDRQIQQMNEEMDKHREQAEKRVMEFRSRTDRAEI